MPSTSSESINNHAAFIWSVADLLRGDYKQSEYGKVVLPLTVLRRLDAVLAPVKDDMLAKAEELKGKNVENFGLVLDQLTEIDGLWNASPFDLNKLLDDPDNLADNLRAYIHDFSPAARDILEHFDFNTQIARLDKAKLLYLVVSKFAEVDLHPDTVSNLEMGYLYEELIRRFSELSNETAGEHFTPREVIKLMVNLLLLDEESIYTPGIRKSIFDPACGTGGMLSVAEEHIRQQNPQARIDVSGQELNPESYAICRSDMMLKGQSAENITLGNSFSEDGHQGKTFDYLLANPPFGVEWKKVADLVKGEHEELGFAGRFGAGIPRINDGSFLFLQHMISKMKTPEQGGSRVAIVFNGSPLFTGAAGSGESEIRRWIIENDWLEAVVALPDQLFYNTGISTYFWIVTNRKAKNRKGKVQLIDARESFTKTRKSLGEKRKEIPDTDIAGIVRLYGAFDKQANEEDEARVKVFPNESFGFMRITVERPLRRRWEINAETAGIVRADSKLSKLSDEQLNGLIASIENAAGVAFEDEKSAKAEAEAMLTNAGAKPTAVLTKALVAACAVPDPDGPPITNKKGEPQPDSDLRDNENVPLPKERVHYEPDATERLNTTIYVEAIDQYLESEVEPYVADAWCDYAKTKIGYEVPLTRHFYTYTPPRPLAEIDAEIKQLEAEIQALLAEVTE